MEEEKEPTRMRVVDKRRFDSDGNERPDDNKTNAISPGPEVKPKEAVAKPSPDRSPHPDDEDNELTLTSFIMSLATQAMMQLGEIPPPPGVRMEKNIDHAKQTIDILSMLFNKTAGNRDEEEEKLFDDILHSLRISFVKGSK